MDHRSIERDEKFTQNRAEHYLKKIRKEPLTILAAFFIKRFDHQTIFSALAWLSKRKFVSGILYKKHKKWFQRWVEQMPAQAPDLAYQKFIFSDLFKYVSHAKRLSGITGFPINSSEAAKKVKFADSIINSFRQLPKGSPHPDFPIIGLEYFLNTLKSQKPVILVSFHSNVHFNYRELFEYQLGIDPIEVITHNRGEYGKYGDGEEDFNQVQKITSNAGATVEALRYLADGRVVIFYADTNDPMTKNFVVPIFGREFLIKGGFAEIAEAVGATIIPMVSLISDDFKLTRAFYPPLASHKTQVRERVEDLIRQYAAFMEKVYVENADAMDLHKIKRFFERKRI